MHILVISEIFPPDMAGSATRAYNIAKGLIAKGHKVTVIAGFPHYPTGNVPHSYRRKAFSRENVGNIDVIRTYVPPLASKGFLKRAVLFVVFSLSSTFPFPVIRKVDGVFASNPQIISFFPALLYKAVHRCRIILNVDDLWPENLYDLGMLQSSNSRRFGEFVARVAYSGADAIAPISPTYVDVITTKYVRKKGKITVVPGGVDLSMFPVASSESNGEKEFTVMYIGAFSPAYDFNQVLMAAKLLEGRQEIRIIIRGGGEVAPLIRDGIREFELSNIWLIESIVPREEVVKIMSSADVLLLPLNGTENVEKGISSKLYEYQAVGKPIICCSRGTPGRYVRETESGIVVEPGDYEELARVIMYLLNHREIAEKYGLNGRDFVEKNLSLLGISSKLLRMFEHSRLRT